MDKLELDMRCRIMALHWSDYTLAQRKVAAEYIVRACYYMFLDGNYYPEDLEAAVHFMESINTIIGVVKNGN